MQKQKDSALASTGGTYHVLLQFDSSNHMSFSDLPLLLAKNNSDAVIAARILQATCRYTREFFDITLRGMHSRLYDEGLKMQFIEEVKTVNVKTKAMYVPATRH